MAASQNPRRILVSGPVRGTPSANTIRGRPRRVEIATTLTAPRHHREPNTDRHNASTRRRTITPRVPTESPTPVATTPRRDAPIPQPRSPPHLDKPRPAHPVGPGFTRLTNPRRHHSVISAPVGSHSPGR